MKHLVFFLFESISVNIITSRFIYFSANITLFLEIKRSLLPLRTAYVVF